MTEKFAHLHTHTVYSLKDGVSTPDEIFKKASDHGMSALAVTDHGTAAGVWKSAKAAKKYGVKFIPGVEFYLTRDVSLRGKQWGPGSNSHLVLMAMDQRGYENLLTLVYRSNKEGRYYDYPRIDLSMLREHNEGLMATTACLGGMPAKAFKRGESPDIAVSVLHEIFGDRLSLEIQVNGIELQENYNKELIRISRETKIPLIAALDSHYTNQSDYYKQDLVFAMQMGKALDDPTRYRMMPDQNSFETPEEATARFVGKYGQVGRDAMKRTIELAENSNVEVMTYSHDYRIPSLDIQAHQHFEEFVEWKSDFLAQATAPGGSLNDA